MEYALWSPCYRRIQAEFGFPFEREERSADRLEALLSDAALNDPLGRVRLRLAGRDVVVVGLAPGVGPPPLWKRRSTGSAPVIVAADGAAAVCLSAGLVPTVVVTDLDGPVASEVTANQRGALVVVHAHGDNLSAIEEWLPQFDGELAGSWAGPPRPGLLDVGGFTDGDRSVFLAEHVAARSVLLWGFDFQRVEESDPTERVRKLAKLRFAEAAVGFLASHTTTPILEWRRDGTTRPYGGNVAASTK